MDDLRQRLTAALGTQYRIERELGGGGMSQVFLAEETALGRKVVIKVLPPELARVVSPERFQREVRLAAALQHPHIVPLLAAGEADGVLYYTMPFIEGESLRARMNREGALPITEAVRCLRDLADALDGAHTQGIVHRDIKPENILLAHHHATVTDFGIAKAIGSAGGEVEKLTGTGTMIGTPAYMAPEQATADSKIDHRADLYALGVIGYELLSGEPPFRGPTPQAVIAAHITRSATPISELRHGIPDEVAGVIMRCLEKLPADRVQHAAEIIAALEPFITVTRSGAHPLRSGTAAQGRSLPAVLSRFGLASLAVLGLASVLQSVLGLPGWFLPAAAVLLGLGLPIITAAALVRHHVLTMKRAVAGGLAAFSALGVGTAVYMAMRLLGIGPVGSLVASGRLGERERLIIADFSDHTPASALGPALTQAFRVDFSQSRLISPLQPDQVQHILDRMARPETAPLDLATAREAAVRDGIKAVVAGEVRAIGASLMISAQLVDAQSGEVLATARETAQDSTRILEALDQVSKELRARIGESFRSIRSNQPLATVTTSSMQALRYYTQAVSATEGGDDRRGIALLEQAVALDSGFAMAWRKLGVILNNGVGSESRARAAMARAFHLRARLTSRERLLTEQTYFQFVEGDHRRAVDALQALLEEYPDDSWALTNLGVLWFNQGGFAEAESLFTRIIGHDSLDLEAWYNLGLSQRLAGHQEAAEASLTRMAGFFPGAFELLELEAELAIARWDYSGAETAQRALIRKHPRSSSAHAGALGTLSQILAIRGRLAEAADAMAEEAAIMAALGDAGSELDARVRVANLESQLRARPDRAAGMLEATLRAIPLDRIAVLDRPYIQVVQAFAFAGLVDRARTMMNEWERNATAIRGTEEANLLLLGRAYSVAGSGPAPVPAAIPALRVAGGPQCQSCADAALAVAFDRAGQPDSALAWFKRFLKGPRNASYWGLDEFWEPIALLRVAQLLDERGDGTEALRYYGRFTALWKDADPDLQPKVQEVKQRMATLAGEPRKP